MEPLVVVESFFKETSSSSISSALSLQASVSDHAADDLVIHNLGSSPASPISKENLSRKFWMAAFPGQVSQRRQLVLCFYGVWPLQG